MAWRMLAIGIVAMGTQWPVIDLPYPDVPEGGGAPAGARTAEQEIERAICRYTHLGHPMAPRADIAQLRIDGQRATALVTSGARVEWVHLEQSGSEWRVVQTFAHR